MTWKTLIFALCNSLRERMNSYMGLPDFDSDSLMEEILAV